MGYTLGAIDLLVAAFDRAELERREWAILDARAALADKAGFKKYMLQFRRRVKRV